MQSDRTSESQRDTYRRLVVGQRLASAVCSANVVVLEIGSSAVELRCGGAAMVPGAPIPCSSPGRADPRLRTVAGETYRDDASGLMVRCTGSGRGALTVDGRVLAVVRRPIAV